MVSKEAPLIVLNSKSDMCMAKNGKDTKHTRHIASRMHFVRNGEKCKMPKIDWCEGGLQFADIGSKSAMCMAKNSKDTKHTIHIASRMHFVRNVEKCKMPFHNS